MTQSNSRQKYILPRPDEVLAQVTRNILYNLRQGTEAAVYLPPLVQRAHTIVNETGVLPVRDYTDQDKLIMSGP